jgi:hypothetical protein
LELQLNSQQAGSVQANALCLCDVLLALGNMVQNPR